ncbi:helix-turn-helix domain-containing protein [Thauera butanivorans]|uniref:helix-turn-helix domain-containing protein n=1 Tax=Thauera butanivorans TaxID=86174 RepID=UPI000AD1E1E0|nr:helix-turn-helix domain-containing protein [Thauera butanivorans]
MAMQKSIQSVADLGLVLRAVRKSQGLRLDDLAGSAGVGHVFAREVEHGKETVQMGRVLRLLEEAGVRLSVDISVDALPYLEALQATGLKPLKPRAPGNRKKAPR